nr:S4 domain-containing protein [Candidatus Dactylopiibacterium carminicum]
MNHSHFLVNGRPVNIPSYRIRVGDVVSVRQRSRELLVIRASLADLALTRPEWLHMDEANFAATVSHLPAISDVPFPIEMQLVVEYYSQRL